jgi:glycosyltransferase involved in cell wall biosynthesis
MRKEPIIVMGDGSTDGTVKIVETEFPYIVYDRQSSNKAPAYLRNQTIERASCSIVLSVTDDARFASPSTRRKPWLSFD